MGPFFWIIALVILSIVVLPILLFDYFLNKWQNSEEEKFISKEEYDKQREKMTKSVEHKKGEKLS